MSQHRGFTRVSALGPISDFVEHQGGRITRVFQQADLPLAILGTPDLPLPLSEQFKVLQYAGRETGDPYFGARLGRLVRVEQLSDFGRWVSAAPSVRAAIMRSNRGLNRFLQTGTNLSLTQEAGLARWSIEFLDPGFEGRFQNELLGVSYLIDVIRCFMGRGWVPDLVRVTGTRSNQAAILERIFQAPVLAGNRVSAIEFPVAILNAAKPAPQSPGGKRFTTNERRIPDRDSPLGEVSAMISVAMLDGYPRIDWVAAKLGMTRRTLQRRLIEQGRTFTALLEDEMRAQALLLLADRDRSITEIALELGYSDPAHFSRAFIRWCGTSPKAFRQGTGTPPS